MRSHSKWVAGLLIVGSMFSSIAAMADLYVISNPALSLTEDEVKAVYSGKKGSSLAPVDNKAAQADFLSKVMNVPKSKYDADWVKKSFQEGISQPALQGSDADVIKHVKENAGGVGYVSTDPGAGVKVIKKY